MRKGPESNKDGQRVGERILVLCKEKTQDETQAVLAWTSGSTYQEIRSASVDDVLAFEKQLKAKELLSARAGESVLYPSVLPVPGPQCR